MKKLALGIISTLLFATPALAQVYPTYPSYPSQPSYTTPYIPSFCPQLSYNLYRGLSDYYTRGQVSQLQQFLASRGYSQVVTGYFGGQTFANVVRFQREAGVYPLTGGVGPLTRAAIVRTCGGYPGPVPQQGLSAHPSVGSAPLTVTFTVAQTSGSYFAIDFGDGQSANTLQGSVTHTYTVRGTYTATATSDLPCLHTQPQCYTLVAQQLLGSATITVY